MNEFYETMCRFARLPIASSKMMRVARICTVLGAENANEASDYNGTCIYYQTERLAQWRNHIQQSKTHVRPLIEFMIKKQIATDPRGSKLENILLRTGMSEDEARAVSCASVWCNDKGYVLETGLKISKHNMRCAPILKHAILEEMGAFAARLDKSWQKL